MGAPPHTAKAKPKPKAKPAEKTPARAKRAPGADSRAAAAATVREEGLAELGAAFRDVFRSLSRLRGRDTHLSGGELSHAQFELLIELHERGDLPAGELATAARLTPGTVTQMLDHLADCGHVERVRSEIDRRVVLSRLTPQGRERIEAKRAAWKEGWERALQDVGSRELRAATKVLERLGAMVEEDPPRDCSQTPVATPGSPAKAAQN
ncbi:MAG TPA: MarR family winged helix-turn-helix transcriptional regulator [Solirubrobacteraceae bacterium]